MLQAKHTAEVAGDQDKGPSDSNKHGLSGNDKVFIKLYFKAGHFLNINWKLYGQLPVQLTD